MTDRPMPGGLANSLHLHARSLTLPREGKADLTLIAPLPPHMKNAFELFSFNPSDDAVDWESLQ